MQLSERVYNLANDIFGEIGAEANRYIEAAKKLVRKALTGEFGEAALVPVPVDRNVKVDPNTFRHS